MTNVRGWGNWVRAVGAPALLAVVALAGCERVNNPGDVVVSFAFDEGYADGFDLHSMLAANGQTGTWYIRSANVDQPGYLSKDQLLQLQGEGHEVGAQLAGDYKLSDLRDYEQKYQICSGRKNLMAMGLRVDTFSFAADEPGEAAKDAVAACGYEAAKTSTGLASAVTCKTCPWAESIPPDDPYAVRTINPLSPDSELTNLQSRVEQVHGRKGGGWLVFVVRHVCAGSTCPAGSVDPALLTNFAGWLASHDIPVMTIRDVAGMR